jgi:hypothetical protein
LKAMAKSSEKLKQGIKELRNRLDKEKENIQEVQFLVNHKVEREPGIWEYDFDELESEIWNRYSILEKRIRLLKRISEEISEYSGRKPRDIFKFFKKLKGNIIKQNEVNQEELPFYLAVMLSLQKMKDRLNTLEYEVKKIKREKDDLISEIEEYKFKLIKKK